MRHRESHFEYYNTSARPFVHEMRELLESWFADYPEGEAKNDVRQRFRGRNDRNHWGAVFELFIHALIRAMGYSAEPHPEIPNGKGGRPDFKVFKDGLAVFYLEATLANLSEPATERERTIASIREAIDWVKSSSFRIDIEIDEFSAAHPDLNTLRQNARRWVEQLDPNAIASLM